MCHVDQKSEALCSNWKFKDLFSIPSFSIILKISFYKYLTKYCLSRIVSVFNF